MEYQKERFEAEIDVESYIEGFVDVETFLECCHACPGFGKSWMCPPFDFDPLDYWRAHEKLRVVGYRLSFGEDRTQEEMNAALWEVKRIVADELYELEEQYPGSVSLSAGDCQVCKECTRPEGLPCRFPERARHSIESIGGNVGKTTSKLCGIEIKCIEDGRLPDHYVLVGGLLI